MFIRRLAGIAVLVFICAVGDVGLAQTQRSAPTVSPTPTPTPTPPPKCQMSSLRHCSSVCNGEYGTLCFPGTVCNPSTHRCEKTSP
jgi:hypothetical protein